MKVIFISGAYRHKTEWQLEEHIRKAEDAALRLWQLGWVVICPHKNTAHFGGACDDKVWLEGDLELLRRSDAIYLLSRWQQSVGACAEYELARELGKVIHEEDFTPFPRP
jgi:hypothetical protein